MASDPVFRLEKFPIGIASVGLGEIERRIPADEPPALRPNAELSVIGKPIPRQNALGKVTGATRFTVDVALPGMLYGRILRSASPHARIRALDLSAAVRHPEVRASLAIARPGDSASGIVRYVGAPIAAIAATSIAAAKEATALIRVDAQPLPFVVDMDAAKAPGAAIVHDEDSAPDGHPSGWPSPAGLPIEGNVRGPAVSSRGDAAKGLAEAEIVVEGEYRTQTQTHCCLEPHAIVADWRDDGLTVYMSTQFTAGVREQLAEEFGLPLENVRVIVDGMGGGFGSKSSLGNYGRIAVALSRQAGAPVRIALERGEEQIDAGNRPETWQRLRIGARRDGTLTAISLQSYGSAGVALGAGVGFFAQGLYACPNFESSQYDVFINAGPGCAMRGPGNTPGAFAMEQAIDELAERLGLDPLALRERIDPSPVRREERQLGAQRFGWERRRAPGADAGPVKRGLGVAQSLWGANVQTRSSCEVRVNRDGAIEILSGVQDIGTGVGTVMAQTVAEVFGLRSEDVVVRIGDTAFPPGPPSYGSRTTASITPPARVAAWRALQALLREAALLLNVGADDLVAREGRIAVRGDPSRGLAFREAAMRMSVDRISATASRSDDYGGFRRRMPDAAIADQDLGGVQFAEVAVDAETGIVRVERVVAAQDCGRPMNPLLIESQVQGGVLMGLSYALYEARILDAASGRMVNPNLEQYKLAGPRETPAIDVVLLENYRANSATDAYGIAEPSNIATAPAIANAIYNAIGVRLRSLPMTPAAILQALGKIDKRG
jgi:xanthine dehydrogenase YagR molybdenum-binding subunit